MTKFLLSLAERLLDRILPTRRPEPRVPPHPLPRDLLHIDRQIRSATRSTTRDGCLLCGGNHGGLPCPDLTVTSVSSPRAITTRHAIPPPPPRKRR